MASSRITYAQLLETNNLIQASADEPTGSASRAPFRN